MKIISDFVDYYDFIQDLHSAKKHHVEFHRYTKKCSPSIVYRVKEKLTEKRLNSVKFFQDRKKGWSMSFFIVGFCDHIHRGVLIQLPEYTDASYTLTGSIYMPERCGIHLSDEVRENCIEHFSHDLSEEHELFDEIECPTFVIVSDEIGLLKIIKNPCLSDYAFAKSKSSFDAYSQLKNFLKVKNAEKKTNNNTVWFNRFLSVFFPKSIMSSLINA